MQKQLKSLLIGSAVIWLSAYISGCATNTGNSFQQVPAVETTEIDKSKESESSRPLSAQSLYDLMLAELALRRGSSNQAIDLYIQQAKTQQDPSIAEQAAKLAYTLELYSTVITACDIWLSLDSNNYEAISLKAIALMNLRKAPQAYILLEQSLNNPDTALFTHLALHAKNDQQRWQLNKYYLKLLNEKSNNNLNLLLGIAYLNFKKGNAEQAMSYIKRAQDIDAQSLDALLLETEVLHAQNDPDALNKLKRFLDSNPQNHEAHDKALSLLTKIDPDAALNILNPLLKKNPKPYLMLRLAKANLQLKRYRNAEVILERLLLSPGYQTQAHYLLGLIKRKQERLREAVAHFHVSQQKNYLVPATEALIGTLIAMNDQKTALQQFDIARGKASKPSSKLHLFLLEASLRHQLKDYSGALRTFDRALRHFPNNLQARYNRALINFENKNISAAVRDLQGILKTEPQYSPALNALAYIYSQNKNQLNDANILIDEALKITPENPEYLDTKGWIAFLQGDYPGAIQYLQLAYQKKKDPAIAAHLGESLWANNNKEKALEVWSEARILFPGNPVITKTLDRLNIYPQLLNRHAKPKSKPAPADTDFNFNFN